MLNYSKNDGTAKATVSPVHKCTIRRVEKERKQKGITEEKKSAIKREKKSEKMLYNAQLLMRMKNICVA